MFNVLAGNHKKDKSFVRKFFQYGCHCYPGGPDNLLKSGHGRPLDKIDTVCQRHKNCYKCVNAIFNAGRWGIGSVTNCNPENTTYKMILDTTLQTVTCPKDQTLCRKSLCECDLEFATSITGMANFDDEYNPDYLQRNGFDHVNSCPKLSNGNASSELQCCGTKTSFPFVEPLSGKRNECCGSRAFNNDRGECCADDGTDTVRPIGSCTNYQSGYAPWYIWRDHKSKTTLYIHTYSHEHSHWSYLLINETCKLFSTVEHFICFVCFNLDIWSMKLKHNKTNEYL